MTQTQTIPSRPSGAAVPGAVKRPKKYPCQVLFMATVETRERIDVEAAEREETLSARARYYIELGMRAHDAGFGRSPGADS